MEPAGNMYNPSFHGEHILQTLAAVLHQRHSYILRKKLGGPRTCVVKVYVHL